MVIYWKSQGILKALKSTNPENKPQSLVILYFYVPAMLLC